MERTHDILSQSTPAEIILAIFQSCDSTNDVLALARTCRYMHNVWTSNTAAILWRVLSRKTPLMEEALIAVRLTERVSDAARRAEQLPAATANPADLSPSRQLPSLAELKAAFELDYFGRTIVYILRFHSPLLRPFRGGSGEDDERSDEGDPEEPSRMPEFENRIRKAIFRMIIVSGALAGAFHEPRFAAARHPDPEISGLRALNTTYPFELTKKQLAFFDQFGISNMEEMPEEEEAVFGPLGRWLLESILSDKESRAAMADRFERGYGRSLYCRSRGDCPLGFVDRAESHSDAHLVVWELMQMVWADERMDLLITGPGTEVVDGPSGSTLSRKATAVFFGRFEAEEIRLPAFLPTETPNSPRPRRAPEIRRTPNPAAPTFTMHFLGAISVYSGRPNRYRTTVLPGVRDALPPLAGKFLVWFFHRYMGLAFATATFVSINARQEYRGLLNTFAIFSHDDIEGRSPHDPEDLWVQNAGFLDGSELLMKTDPNLERFYSLAIE